MNMKDVKAISIPVNGVDTAVKKIVNSNGDIIWGSQAAFPYRRLEYIHLNGTDNYVALGKPTYPANYALFYKSDSTQGFTLPRALGSYDNSAADNARRVYLISNGDNSQVRWSFGNQWSDWTDISAYTGKIIKHDLTISSTGKIAYCGVRDPETNEVIVSVQLTTGGAVGQGANLAIGTNMGSSGQIESNAMWKGNCYRMQKRQNNASGSLLWDCIPAQRKSDGQLGLYNVSNSIWLPLQGTVDSSSAGPVVDEYWDLTA